MSDNPYKPFSNGTQWMDWQSCNCERCVKYNPDAETPEETCSLEFILSLGGETGDGSVTEQTARRMGYLTDEGEQKHLYVWPCAEVEWTQAYLDEWARKRGYADHAAWKAAQP